MNNIVYNSHKKCYTVKGDIDSTTNINILKKLEITLHEWKRFNNSRCQKIIYDILSVYEIQKSQILELRINALKLDSSESSAVQHDLNKIIKDVIFHFDDKLIVMEISNQIDFNSVVTMCENYLLYDITDFVPHSEYRYLISSNTIGKSTYLDMVDNFVSVHIAPDYYGLTNTQKRTLIYMKSYIDYLVTIRELADEYNVSKSCIHNHLKHRLKEILPGMSVNIQKEANTRKRLGQVLGGQTTKDMWARHDVV